MEEDTKNNEDIINKLNDEISQTKLSLATKALEYDEKLNELKVKNRKLTTLLESKGIKLKK